MAMSSRFLGPAVDREELGKSRARLTTLSLDIYPAYAILEWLAVMSCAILNDIAGRHKQTHADGLEF